MGDVVRWRRLEGDAGRGYTALMTSWFGPRSLALAALWAVLGLAVVALVAPPAEAGWPSYVGILGVYVAAGAAFVRERRRMRRWT